MDHMSDGLVSQSVKEINVLFTGWTNGLMVRQIADCEDWERNTYLGSVQLLVCICRTLHILLWCAPRVRFQPPLLCSALTVWF
jgi:hypothetical protein